jgi:hypothetical protein
MPCTEMNDACRGRCSYTLERSNRYNTNRRTDLIQLERELRPRSINSIYQHVCKPADPGADSMATFDCQALLSDPHLRAQEQTQ